MSKVDSKLVEAYYEQYPPGTEVEVYYQHQWQSAKVVNRYHKSKGSTVYIEVDTDAGRHLFLPYGARGDIRLRFPPLEHTAEEKEMIRGYEWALKVLETNNLEDSCFLDVQEAKAVNKAKQALRDCLDIGLNGEGE